MNLSTEPRVLPPSWHADPVVNAARIVEMSGVELDQLRFWICPCCGVCRVVYAQDSKGSVWLSLTLTLYPTEQVFRLDKIDDIDELIDVARDGEDRLLLAWYATGLYEELTQLFLS